MRKKILFSQIINSGKMTKYLLFLLIISLFAEKIQAQPVLRSIQPNYEGNQVLGWWNAVANAQAYSTRVKVNSSNYSAWDSIAPNFLGSWKNINFTTNDTIYFQVRVKVAGVWSGPSNTKYTIVRRNWPVLNTANTGPSRNLMHNFNHPIKAGGKIYLHEGVDINGDYNTKTETVLAALSGEIVAKGQSQSGKYVYVKFYKNGAVGYYSYNHMVNLRANVVVGNSINAGDTIGNIVDSFWNTQCYHIHLHYEQDWNNTLGTTKNPLLNLFTNNLDKDPAGTKPVSLNTNDDNKNFKFLIDSNWANTTVDTIAYSRVDIQWELLDRMSSNGFYQNPYKAAYYIQKKVGNIWKDTVRSAASPYILFKNDVFYSDSLNKTSNSILNALFIKWDTYRSKPPITPTPDYVFWEWFTWLLTNTKGWGGSKTDIGDNFYWGTNARTTETWGNGAGPNGNLARSIDEAEFPDGVYKVHAIVSDLIQDTSFSKIVMVQNFKPIIKEVEVYAGTFAGAQKIYHAKWNWVAASNNYQYQKIKDTLSRCDYPMKVVIKTSEPMKSVKLEIPSISFTSEKTTTSDTLTTWEFVVGLDKHSKHTSKKQKLIITGKDLENTDVFGFQNTGNFSGNNMPKRNNQGTWTPSTASQPDIVHYFMFDSLNWVGIEKLDVKCPGEVTGMVKAIPHSGVTPYQYYLWNYNGLRTQTLSPVPAGYYKVTAWDGHYCKGYADTNVEEPQPIVVSIAGGPAVIPFCIQDGNPTVTLTASASGGKPPYTYSWPNQTLIVSSTGIYRCEVKDSNGCTASGATFVWFIPILCSRDPNDITGPAGYGTEQFVSKTEPLYYNVRFENDPDFATAPAQKVVVTLPFDPKMDMYSFRLKDFGFGDFTFQAPANKTSYSTRLDVVDSLGVYVDFIAGIDPTKGEAFWIFESIGPSSGLPPDDPNKGFLPVNDSTNHRGEGFVSFYIFPKSNVATGDSVKAKAKIVFDIHSPIYTNTWFNIFDAVAPNSKVNNLPASIDSTNVNVSWKGNDDNKGSGVISYDLYVSENNSSFSLFKKDIKDTFTTFIGDYGSDYRFYSRAKDNVGNKEGAKTVAEATIKIKPFQMIVKPDSNSSYCLGSVATIAWKSIDIPYINLKYTADSGRTYQVIANGVDIEDSTYNWKIPDTLSGNKVYKILVTNAQTDYGLSSSDYFYIRKLPVADAGSDKNVCYGKSVSLGGSPTASGTKAPYVYAWRPSTTLNDDSISNPAASPIANTYYNVIVKDSFGCMNEDTVEVTVKPMPLPSFAVSKTSDCLPGNSFTFYNTSSLSNGTYTRKWKFGDGSTATSDTSTHTYNQAGVYTVWLVITSDANCSDSISKTITVNPKPQVAFSINDTDQCKSQNNFILSNTSTIGSGTLSYLWQFDYTDTSTAQSPAKSFVSSGLHYIKLIATSDKGCKDSLIKTVTVYETPTIAFSINNDTQCINNNSFTFTNSSTISNGTLTHLWKFGDNTTSTQNNPVKSFTSSGLFDVKLISTSNNGCSDSLIKSITVFPKPVVQFTINDTDQCYSSNTFTFTNSSTISSGSMTYLWNFGDNTSSTTTSPSHTYNSKGAYTVKLLATSNNGCSDSLSKSTYVWPQANVSFSVNDTDQCKSTQNFMFTNNSSITNGSLSYLWNFGDNTTSTSASPTKTYTNAGTYSVKLITTSDKGCSDSLTKSVIVYPNPVSSFTTNADSLCFKNNSFTFTNNTTISSGTLNYIWTFGDNTSSTATSPTHSYSSTGTFTVKLVAASSFGCSDSVSKNVTVRAQPTVAFSMNDSDQCKNGNNFSFTNQSSVNPGNLSYLWDFGDTSGSTQTSPSHTYQSTGNFTVKLIATSNYGCKDSVSKSIVVYPSPTASFTSSADSLCFKNNNFSFTNNSTISAGSLSYLWTFGDNNSSTTSSPSHSYLNTGTYNVKLIATSGYGCSDSVTKDVTVRAQPTVNFSINDSDQCKNTNNFIFTNLSSVNPGNLTYLWKFGDNTSSNLNSPQHTYSAAGSYVITLIATSNYGCMDSMNKSIIVYPVPKADFTINSSSQCLNNNNFQMSNISYISSGTMSYAWSFGDNTFSSLQNPTKNYNNDGQYTIKLIVQSDKMCLDSISNTIYVRPVPKVSFTINDSDQCFNGNSFIFNNSSTINSGILVCQYIYGDGNGSPNPNDTHSFGYADTFNVKLVAVSDFNCKDSSSAMVYVHPSPVPDFNINDSMQCFKNNHFIFNNLSGISSGKLSYLWDFHDAYTSTFEHTSHIYLKPDTLSVMLTATSDLNCKDSISKNVYVFPSPELAFDINDSTQCLNTNDFNFTNQSSIKSGLLNYLWSFGDGDTSSVLSPIHKYNLENQYYVLLNGTSDLGCSDSLIKMVKVFPSPVSSFTVDDDAQCLRGNVFNFKNNSLITSGTFTSEWHFVGETDTQQKYISNSQDPIFSYDTTGYFNVKLVNISNNLCKDSVYKGIIVYKMPVIDFSFNNICLGDTARFIDKSHIDSPSFMSAWYWQFGDGNHSVLQSPKHVYQSAGSYSVEMKAYTVDGCFDSITRSIEVYPLPDATFTMTYDSNGAVIFTANADTTHTFEWNFGDGDSATGKQVNHKYNANGNYLINLKVYSSHGCLSLNEDTAKVRNSLSEEELYHERFRMLVYPNPFSNLTNIRFDINNISFVRLSVYDAYGKEVEVLKNGELQAGRYEYTFGSNHNYAAGIYFIRLNINNKLIVERVIKVLLPY